MKIALPEHRLTVTLSPELAREWTLDDEEAPGQRALHGLYFRSVAYGVYFNVRAQAFDDPSPTRDGLVALLREQMWASSPFAAFAEERMVGACFEMKDGGGGEIVLEVFVTDGALVANLAGPGERAIIEAVTPAVKRLANAVTFG